jgi:hypothetical protein
MTDENAVQTRTKGSLAAEMARNYSAMRRCEDSGNDYSSVWGECLDHLIALLPHGSGIDSDWIVGDETHDGLLVLHNSYHLMDGSGMYCGWAPFKVIVAPDWEGINLDVEIDGSGIDDTVYSTQRDEFDDDGNLLEDEDMDSEPEEWSDADGLDGLDDMLAETMHYDLKRRVIVTYSGIGESYVELDVRLEEEKA